MKFKTKDRIFSMDDGGIPRNWGAYFEHQHPTTVKNLGLNLMSDIAAGEGDPKTLIHPNGNFLNYNSWIRHRENNSRFLQVPPNYPVLSDPQTLQILHTQESHPVVEETVKEVPQTKKRRRNGAPKIKKPKKPPIPREPSSSRVRNSKKASGIVINGLTLDISELPTPVCSCTGAPQQCYRWGIGGWQSACCTTTVSLYPLPMSSKRRGARIAGRKMSQGAFKKVLEKLAGEGFDLSSPIDLNGHWAKHGTNKYVTIR